MWREFLAAGMFLGAGIIYAEELVAHWDFTRGTINSVDGNYKAAFRGTTRIAGNEKDGKYLAIGMSSHDKPEGIVMAEKYPALSPSQGFRIEAKIRLQEQSSTHIPMVIWDNKYTIYKPAKDSSFDNHGFAFILSREKSGFRPVAWLGYGNTSDVFYGKPVKMEEEKIYNLSFEYDGSLLGTFKVDGNLNQVYKAKNGGPVSPAIYNTVIGDRFGSYFSRFDGHILEVKLFQTSKTEKK